MERKETIGAAPEVLEAFPQEAEHLRELEEKIALELHAAQESVDKMDQEYREAQQYIADSRGGGRPQGDVPDPDAHGADRRPGGPRRWCTGTG